MSTPGMGSVTRPTAAAANNIQKFRASSRAAAVLKPAAAAAAPARPLAPQPGQVVRTLLGAIKSAAPVILGVTAVELLAPRSANQSEVSWLTRRRAEQFVGDLNDGLGVPQALSRLSAGLFVNDISAAKFQAERSGLAKAIALQDSTAALRHFGTIAKAMAFDTSVKSAGVAAVRREIARLTNASAPAPVSLRASGKAHGAPNPSHNAHAARAQGGHAPKASPRRLPALGGSTVATPPQRQMPGTQFRPMRTGTTTEVEARAQADRIRRFYEAKREFDKAKKTLLPYGSVEALAQRVLREAGLGGRAGSETGSLAHLRRLGNVQGASGVRASGSGGSSQGSGGSGSSGEPALPSDPVANPAHIPSPPPFMTFQQPQQEPQQATRRGELSSNDGHAYFSPSWTAFQADRGRDFA